MKTRHVWTSVFAALTLGLLLVGAVLAQSGQPEISWWVFSGAGELVNAGDIQLEGTLGQPVAGYAQGKTVGLASGFWIATAAEEYENSIYLPLVIH